MTLTDHVLRVGARFLEGDLAALEMWEAAIEAAGFDADDDYSDRGWIVGRTQDFEVEGDFPRIPAPLPSGEGSVRYTIALDYCPTRSETGPVGQKGVST